MNGVSKYKFYYHSGVVRPTYQGMIAIEKVVCYTCRSQEEGAHDISGGHTGKHQCGSGGRRRGEIMARTFTVVSVGRTRQGRESGLGLASLNNFSRLWGIGADPSCLVPGPGMIRAGGWWARV